MTAERDPFGLRDWPYTYRSFGAGVFGYIDQTGLSNMYGLVGPRSVTLIDSTTHRFYARRLAADIERRFARPVGQIVFTHFHRDHILGAQCFAPADGAVSHAACAHRIATHGAEMVAELGAAFAGHDLVVPASTVQDDAGVIETDAGALPYLRVGGHSDDSLILWSPDRAVMFAGDTVFNRVPPYLARWSCLDGFGRIDAWIRALGIVKTDEARHLLSGHGPPATQSDIDDLLRFFEYYAAQVDEGIRQGQGLREIWFRIYRRDHFTRKEFHPELYLHLIKSLFAEWTAQNLEHLHMVRTIEEEDGDATLVMLDDEDVKHAVSIACVIAQKYEKNFTEAMTRAMYAWVSMSMELGAEQGVPVQSPIAGQTVTARRDDRGFFLRFAPESDADTA